jgi:hypothetical protein
MIYFFKFSFLRRRGMIKKYNIISCLNNSFNLLHLISPFISQQEIITSLKYRFIYLIIFIVFL